MKVRRAKSVSWPSPARGTDVAFVPSIYTQSIGNNVRILCGDVGVRSVRPKHLRERWPDIMAEFVEMFEHMFYAPPINASTSCAFCLKPGALRCPVCDIYTHEDCAMEVYDCKAPGASAETMAVMSELVRDYKDVWENTMIYISEVLLGECPGRFCGCPGCILLGWPILGMDAAAPPAGPADA